MDIYLLEMRMKQKHITNEHMANLLQIDPSTFHRKKKGDSEFSRKEIQKIRSELNLTSDDVDKIFFTEVLAET